MRCPTCKREIPESAAFCKFCGAIVASAQRTSLWKAGLLIGVPILVIIVAATVWLSNRPKPALHSNAPQSSHPESQRSSDEAPPDLNGDWGLGTPGTQYDFTESFTTPMPAGREVRVLSARGDITITPSPDDQARVFVHKYVRSSSQEEANQFNADTHPKFEQQGATWLLDMTGGNFIRGRFNVEIQSPANYSVSVLNRQGDLRLSQMRADVDLETSHGDININQVKGNVVLHAHRGDVKVQNVSGNVNVDGDVVDCALSDLGGAATLTGSYRGSVGLSHVAGQVKFNSSRTDLQMARIDGELIMDSSDLKANSVAGPFTLKTQTKDVRLDNISGDVHIEDSRGDIELHATASVGNVEISTTGGEISIWLPENPGFQVDAQSDGGEITSNFRLNIIHGRNATATGTVGQGGRQIKLRTSRGTIQIKKS